MFETQEHDAKVFDGVADSKPAVVLHVSDER